MLHLDPRAITSSLFFNDDFPLNKGLKRVFVEQSSANTPYFSPLRVKKPASDRTNLIP